MSISTTGHIKDKMRAYIDGVTYTISDQQHTHTHTRITALCPGPPGWAGTRKVKPIWILLKQETVSGSGISWDICKSVPRSRQITMPALHCSVQTNKYEINILPFHSRFPTTEPSKIIGLGQLNQATKRHTHRQQNM